MLIRIYYMRSGTIPFSNEKELPKILDDLKTIFGFCDELSLNEENETTQNYLKAEKEIMFEKNIKSQLNIKAQQRKK